MYLFGETLSNSWHICVLLRWCFLLNSAWLINSAGHKYGSKPYDKYVLNFLKCILKLFTTSVFSPGFRNYNPSENGFIAFLTLGEGWHNYHHVFPWDYKTSELGDYSMNYSTAFIDFFAKIGWAYDLKTVSQDVIRRRVQRTGDGSHPIWGWGDKDQSKEERKDAIIINKKNKWISKTRNPDQWTCKVMSIRFWVTNFTDHDGRETNSLYTELIFIKNLF